MKLSEKEKQILLGLGANKDDYLQIERAIRMTDFELGGKKITRKEAIEILGIKTFLSGMLRAAFHWSAARQSDCGKEIYFSCHRFFDKALKNN